MKTSKDSKKKKDGKRDVAQKIEKNPDLESALIVDNFFLNANEAMCFLKIQRTAFYRLVRDRLKNGFPVRNHGSTSLVFRRDELIEWSDRYNK